MTEVSEEAIDAMVRFVTHMGSQEYQETSGLDDDANYAEAARILALLPEPVDPDLIYARQIATQKYPCDYTDGSFDNSVTIDSMVATIKAIRRDGLPTTN